MRTFEWAFRRRIAPAPMPDLLVLRGGDHLMAGSAVNYRTVSLPNGESALAGIMTGSWTLPEARGRGCFSRMIRASEELVAGHGGTMLLAFVTAKNPSRFQLEKAGATLFPTTYFASDFSLDQDAAEGSSRETGLFQVDEDLDSLLGNLWACSGSEQCGFQYARLEDWKVQFIRRPWATVVFGNLAGATAIVEQHAATDRLLLYRTEPGDEVSFLKSLKTHSHEKGKKLFGFASSAMECGHFRNAGLNGQPGFLTAIGVKESGDWNAPQSGFPSPEILAYPCEWRLLAGDRM